MGAAGARRARAGLGPPRALALLAAALLVACATKTEVALEWRNPDFGSGGFSNFFVIGVGEDHTARRVFEDHFVELLRARGVAAEPSYRPLPATTKLSEQNLTRALRGGRHDAVLITRLLGEEKSTEVVPARTYTVPRGHGGGYYGYYGRSYDVVHEPGYTVQRTLVRLETNLYDVASQELVWSGQSETRDPRSVADGIDSMTAAVAARLSEQGLIP